MAAIAVQSAGAGRESTILFTPTDAGMSLVAVSGGFGESSIELDFAPDTPALPKKVAIEVPTGYTIDPGRPGDEIGDTTVSIVTGAGPSFATAYGELVVRDPKEPPDPRLSACSSGSHLAVWSATSSLAGQQLTVLVSVDAGAQPGVAYVLNICTTSLASDTNAAASISLAPEGIVAPTTPGDYRWRAVVTPQGRPAYELQALLPLPESLTLKARYDRKHKRAVVTGQLIEGGKPVARADVFLAGQRNNRTTGLAFVRTDAQGKFTRTLAVTGTTDFTAMAGPGVDICFPSTTLPGGCLGATTIPPDPALTTVWVSPPTGAVRAIRAADQRRAEQLGVQQSDFAEDVLSGPVGGDDCLNPKHESHLTITGESASPGFAVFVEDPPSLVQAFSLSRMYATAAQARRAVAHQARATTVRCVVNRFEFEGDERPQIRPLKLAKVSAQVHAFRAVIAADQGVTLTYDVVFLQRGRAVTILQVGLLNGPPDFEGRLVAALAARMR